MKHFLRSICLLFAGIGFFLVAASAQTNRKKQKAEKALIIYLNKLCKEYTMNEMPIETGTFHESYIINNGLLSVVRKHTTEHDGTTSFFIKTSIVITEIEDVFYDYYIGFVGTNNQSVKEEKSNHPTHSFVSSGTMNLMHVAPVGDGDHGFAVQAKLKELVTNLKKIYTENH